MFQDGRSRRIALIAHCILNQNSISDGTAVYPASFRDVIDFFLDRDIGIVQMPCPELCCLGLDRGNPLGAESPVVVENTRIRRAMETGEASKRLSALIDHVTRQVLEYQKYGFEIVGIVGANRSPNCGVDTTSDGGMEVSGMGLFMEGISNSLARAGIAVPMIGLKSTDDVMDKLRRLLNA